MKDIHRKLIETGAGESASTAYSVHLEKLVVCGKTDRGVVAQELMTDYALPVGDFIFVLFDGIIAEFEVIVSSGTHKVFKIGQTQVGPSKGKPGSMSGTAHGIGNAGQRKS